MPGTILGTLRKLSKKTWWLMIQKTGDGASVVKSLGITSGCLVLNPGPTTYCVTLGKLLKLSVPSSSVKEEKECSENE